MIKKFIGTVLIIYILCVTPNLLFAKWINIPQNNTGALQLTPTISTQPTQTNASRFAPVQTKKIKTPQASVSVNFQENAQNQPAQKQGSKSGVKLAPAPAQNEIINVNISIPGFLLNDIKLSDTNYHSISLSGMNSQNEPGKPALPMKRIFIEIPDNASVSFDIASQQQITFDSIYAQPSKYPKKNSGSDSSAQFVIDNTIYSENSFYPQNIIHNQKIIFMRNHRIFVLDIAPFQFNPVEKKLIVNYELSINVNITPNNISECEYNLSSPEYDKSMSAGIYGFNRYAAPAGVLSTTGFAPQSNNLPHLSNSTSSSVTFQSPVNISGLKYMILMDDQFEANSKLAEFIDWKKRKGLNVTVVKTSQINSNGAPYYPEIVNFMRSLAAADYPDYLLIIGDDDPANGVSAASYNDSLRTDLDIACRTDDDFIPDMFYGRLPASNNSELTLMLTKILEIDRTPPVSSMYDRVLVTGDHEEGRPYLETLDAVACYFEQNAGGRNYDCVRAIVNTYNAEENSYWDNYYSILWQNPEEDCEVIGARLYNTLVTEDEARRRIFKEINDGAALLLHDDHGYELGLGHPYFNYSDVKSLNNKKNLPLIMSINCSTGAYYYPNNFTKEWLTHQNGGAYCVIAASDISYLPSCDWMIHGMFMGLLSDYREWHNNSTNPDWTTDLPISSTNISAEGKAVKLSPMLNFGLMYMLENETYYSLNKLHFQIFHIFGDPEAYIMLHNPENLQVKHPAQINRGNQKIIINAEDGCLVSLYSPELNIHQSVYSSNDSAAFNIYAGSTGKIFVTVTKYTKRPYESVIEINDTMPIGCWKFDDTAGDTILDSVYGLNSGRNFGGQKINGLLNKSLHFNGIDDYAVIPETSVNSLQNFTFSCWGNCETSAYNKNAKIFEISNNPAEPNAAKYFYLTSDNQNKWGFGASVSGVNNEMFTAGYSQLKQNEWAHIALTIGNNTVKLFRNGVEEASSAISIYPKDLQPEKFYLARGFKNNDYFGGCLDEMTIFDRALNSDEIKNLAKNIVNIYAMTETVNENSVSSAKFLIKRYGYCQNAVTVNYSVSGTALPGIDFKNLSGSIIIPAGSDSAYINITLIDNQITGINKNIVLSLISNDNYILGNNTISSLTILDDDKINLPIFENFEDTFGSRLNLSSSSQSGKISVIADGSAPEGAAYLLLEKKDALSECLNSLEFDIKLPKNENLELSFWSKKCGDADNTMYDGPYDPYGRLNWNYDVILVSVVGDYWYKILDLTGANISGNWKKINIDLSAAIAAAGYYNPESVKIRFNQFGAQTDTGGIAFDDIKIYQKKNIKITSPANNTDTMQNIIQLNGTTLFTQAGDSMEIYVNNVLQKIIFINQTNQSFSETVALYGVKNIAKTVLRRGFYSTEDSVVINYCGLPAFTILSPSTGSILTKKNISISLASSTALEGDTVKLFVNGSPQNVFTIAGSLIFPAEIIDGLNNITIFLEDRFNRSVSDSITVYNNFYNISAPDTETGLFYLNISGIIGTDNDYIIYLNNCDSFYLTVSNTDNFDTWSFSANPVDTGLYIKLSSNSIKNKYDTSQIVNFEYGVTTDFKIEFIDKNKQLLNAPHFSDSTILSMNYKNRNITSNPELLRFYCLNIADSKYYELSKNNFQYSNNYENKKLSAITNSIGAFYLGAAKDTLIVLNEQLEQQNINAGDTFVFPLYIQGDTFAGGDTLTKIQIKNTGTLQTLAIDKIDFYRDFGTIGRFDSGVDLYISTLNKIGENNFYSEIICPFSENDTGTHFLFLTKTNTYAFQFDTASFEITAGSIHSAEQNAGPAASLNISKTCSIISGLTNALPLIKILSPVSGETRPTNIINVSGTCANAIQNDTIAIYVNGILQSVFRIDGFSDVWSGTAFITNKTDTITAVITNRKGTAIDFITASFSKIVSVSLTSGSGNYPKYYSRNIVDTVCVISFSLQSAVCDTLTQFGISNAENMLPSKIKSVFLWLDSDANDNYSAADSYICELVWNSSKQSWLNNNINFPFKPNDTKFIVTMNFSGSIMNFDEAFLAEIKPYSIKTFYCETGPIETLKNTGSMIISFLTMQNIQLPLGANNGFTYSCIKNIDFDRDGDLDLLVTGYEINTGNKFLLLRNDNGIFVNDEQPALNNNPIQSGCIDVADYDNDGWVDIAVCGKCNNSDKLILFRNNCGKFEKDIEPLGENFRLFSGTVRWGDYDNDGYPDLAVCGRDSNNYNYYLFILKNERGRLRKISNLIDENNGFNSGDIQWIDYDNDGDLDLTICGVNWPYKFIFFKNTGSGFIKDCEPFGVNTGLGWSKIQWADYNNDGLQDFAVSGFDASTYYYRLILFKNTGSGFIKDCEPLGANNGLQSGNLQWADFDNNGLPDLAVSGSKIDINYLFILLNNNGKFEKRIDLFGYNQGLSERASEVGDYDNDGDIDLVITGRSDDNNYKFIIFENQILNRNQRPAAPIVNTISQNNYLFGDTVYFSWSANNLDAETPDTSLS
ncbi:MAG TPA: C25 family cysteine peptidase, partial [bacterium]|nr:C25 family cysteine peptidase [bacterium]